MRSLFVMFRIAALALALVALGVAGGHGSALAGPYTRLQVLLPGETAAPGTASGNTGTPRAQTAGVPFSITIRACDSGWNTVPTVTNAIKVLASDASATLPADAQLNNGVLSAVETSNAGGTFTLFAHDQTDGTIPDGTSAPVTSLVLQGVVFSSISQKHFTAGVGKDMSIRAVDAQGNTVTGYSGAVKLKETTSFGDGATQPASITLVNGAWNGPLAALRADETNTSRGNANFYAWLQSAPGKNGTSDPFVVHPGPLSRVQVLVPAGVPGATGGGGTAARGLDRGQGLGSGRALALGRGGGGGGAGSARAAEVAMPALVEKPAAASESDASARRSVAGASLAGPIADRPVRHVVTPVNPDWAKRDGVEATVTLYFVVRPDGSVKENVLVQKTAGFSDFDDNARAALAAWRFEPLHGGRTGEQWGTITFHYRLRDA